MKNGILYSGSSLIDGSPIVCIVIGESSNSKTGDMVQTYILRSDIDPVSANRIGADYSICGDCRHRGTPNPNKTRGWADGRSCYVNLLHGPTRVYRAFMRGVYPMLSPEDVQRIGKGRMVRLGTYGDPAAVPAGVFDTLLSGAVGHTGYTHQGMTADKRLMASADTIEEAWQAWQAGRRTFRVIPVATWAEYGKGALQKNETLCPASAEAGKRVQCIDCKLCDGNKKAKSIAIVAHGIGAKHHKG